MNTKKYFGTKNLEKKFGPVTFGKILKNHRDCEEISSKDMAKLLGISVQRLNDYEKGRRFPELNTAAKFAQVLDQSESFFIQILLMDQLRKASLEYDVKVIKKSVA